MQGKQQPQMDRRGFIGAATTALLAGVAVQFLGCDEEGYGSGPASSSTLQNAGGNAPVINPATPASSAKAAATPDKTAVISNPADPKHSGVVTGAEQDADVDLTLHIQGTETHDHTVDLTAQDLMDLKNGMAVVKTSSVTLDHSHTVTWAAATAIVPSIYDVDRVGG